MGEVYRATDTRLGRTVAIKILGSGFTDRAEARERFDREARAISNLNHPHICTLHDVGHQDGIDFLVMEYLEGETLASALERGPIPFDDALKIAIQIGDALDKAHRQGVVHRDLKPGNVMLTKNGAKLLDFGLAKLRASETPIAVSATALPTDAKNLTGAGAIVGTLQYMSPEQLEGKEADARSDVFAFGATLYEMITGRKAFQGKTQVSLMASILEHEPPSIKSLLPILPQALESIVQGCMAKDLEERWQTARDVVRQLRWVQSNPTDAVAAEPTSSGRPGRLVIWQLLAGILLLITAGISFRALLHTDPVPPLVRFDVSPPAGASFQGSPPRFSVSPDGRYVVYSASSTGKPSQLWLRRLDSPDAKPITGTESTATDLTPQFPFWSPDSKYIGFFVEKGNGTERTTKLKVDIEGGPVQTLCEVPSINSAGTWNSAGIILISTSGTKGVQRVAANGGVPVQDTALGKD
jgi:serine/threonine protein kinase